jgi:hypothetical protein
MTPVPWKTHPLAFTMVVVGTLLAAAFTIGLLSGWSNGALGSAEIIIIGLGGALYGLISDPEGKHRRS